MEDRDGWIWHDGDFVPWKEARVHVLTHTLHYGMGVFEGVRAYMSDEGTAIFRMRDHTERLFNSARMMDIEIPYTDQQLNEAQKRSVETEQSGQCLYTPDDFLRCRRHGFAHQKKLKVHGIVAAWEWGCLFG